MSAHKQHKKNDDTKVKLLYWIIPAAVVAIALLVVVFSASSGTQWSLGNMMGGSGHANMSGMQNHMITSELQYISEMIPHHQEAVDTARIIAGTTTNNGVKQLVDTMVAVQSSEIDQLNAWKKEFYPKSSYRVTYQKMMPNLALYNGSTQDLKFLQGMLMHHQMAIMMSQQALKLNLHPEVRAFAENVILAQGQEMSLMQRISGNI